MLNIDIYFNFHINWNSSDFFNNDETIYRSKQCFFIQRTNFWKFNWWCITDFTCNNRRMCSFQIQSSKNKIQPMLQVHTFYILSKHEHLSLGLQIAIINKLWCHEGFEKISSIQEISYIWCDRVYHVSLKVLMNGL